MNSNENKEHQNTLKKRKIFVRKLGNHIKEADLKKYFSSFGPVQVVEVLRNLKTQQSRRVAYVTFKNQKTVDRLFSGEQTKFHLLGKDIECERCLLAEELSSSSSNFSQNGKPRNAFSNYSTNHSSGAGSNYTPGGFPTHNYNPNTHHQNQKNFLFEEVMMMNQMQQNFMLNHPQHIQHPQNPHFPPQQQHGFFLNPQRPQNGFNGPMSVSGDFRNPPQQCFQNPANMAKNTLFSAPGKAQQDQKMTPQAAINKLSSMKKSSRGSMRKSKLRLPKRNKGKAMMGKEDLLGSLMAPIGGGSKRNSKLKKMQMFNTRKNIAKRNPVVEEKLPMPVIQAEGQEEKELKEELAEVFAKKILVKEDFKVKGEDFEQPKFFTSSMKDSSPEDLLIIGNGSNDNSLEVKVDSVFFQKTKKSPVLSRATLSSCSSKGSLFDNPNDPDNSLENLQEFISES